MSTLAKGVVGVVFVVLILGAVLRRSNISHLPQVPIPDNAVNLRISYGLLGYFEDMEFLVREDYPSTAVYDFYKRRLGEMLWTEVPVTNSDWATNGWESFEDLSGRYVTEWDQLHAEWIEPHGSHRLLLGLHVKRRKGMKRPHGIWVSVIVERRTR